MFNRHALECGFSYFNLTPLHTGVSDTSVRHWKELFPMWKTEFTHLLKLALETHFSPSLLIQPCTSLKPTKSHLY